MKGIPYSSMDSGEALPGAQASRPRPARPRILSMPLRLTERRWFLVVGDMVALCVAGAAAVGLWSAVRSQPPAALELAGQHGAWLLTLGIGWLLLSGAAGAYDLRVAARTGFLNVRLLVVALGLASGYLVLYYVLAIPPAFLRRTIPGLLEVRLLRVVPTLFIAAALAAQISWRNLYARVLTGDRFQRRTLVVGAGGAGAAIAEVIAQSGDGCYDLVGFVDDDPAKLRTSIPQHGAAAAGKRHPKESTCAASLRVLGNRHQLKDLVALHDVSTLVLAISNEPDSGLLSRLIDCLELGVDIIPMPVLYEQLTSRVPVAHVGYSWHLTLPIEHPGTGVVWPLLKRAIDIALAVVGLACLGLILPVVALAIYLDSGGPVFYSQNRVGKGGRVFRLYKLRSMVPSAENGRAIWAARDDPRTTRVGRFLRKTHIDELPQFYNILRGDMSMVGPRPERPEFVRRLAHEIPFYRVRHAVRPGATGWGQINQGYVSSKAEALLKLEYDLYYIKHQSLWLDLVILLRTIGDTLRLGGR